jgi:ubiquinone/menaquinone biosynthesis C-methylase UbiE
MTREAEFTGSIPLAYDRYLGPLLFDPHATRLVAQLELSGIGAALELACGTGILTRRLRRALPAAAQLTATDLNEPMLEHARARTAEAGLSGVAWRQADAQELPFVEGSFDLVVCQFGVMFFPDKLRALREARRVLRPGGRLAFSTWLSLAENPAPRIARDTITRFFASDPPTFYDMPFGFHDQGAIGELLRQARFQEVAFERVELQGQSPSAADAARGFVTGNPIWLSVSERATAPVEEILAAVANALADEGGAAPFRVPTRALITRARAAA